jgi:RES domain
VILWRLLPWQARASAREPGGALWFPRELQGAGRHDNPDRYACLYVSEQPASALAEALAPFRGTGRLSAAMLNRAGLALALARIELEDDGALLDLDDPRVLAGVGLRPSQVATNMRDVTQAYAERLFDEHPEVLGLRWWSALEASLVNLTLYDRAAQSLALLDVDLVTLEHPAVSEAAEMLGLSA